MARVKVPTKARRAPKLTGSVPGFSDAKSMLTLRGSRNNAKIHAVQRDNARVSKIHNEGAAASKRARARGGSGGGQRRDRKGRWA